MVKLPDNSQEAGFGMGERKETRWSTTSSQSWLVWNDNDCRGDITRRTLHERGSHTRTGNYIRPSERYIADAEHETHTDLQTKTKSSACIPR